MKLGTFIDGFVFVTEQTNPSIIKLLLSKGYFIITNVKEFHNLYVIRNPPI